MNFVIDACSIINLNNAGALEVALGLQSHRFWVCPGVVGECRPEVAARLLALIAGGELGFIADDRMSAARVLELLDRHGLGVGETESIATCEALGYGLCSDDRPARRLGQQLLGQRRVTGTLRLLQWCVKEELVRCGVAFGFFETMLARGGFLPPTSQGFFCSGTSAC